MFTEGGHCLQNVPYPPFPHSFVTFEEHLSLKWLESALQSSPFHTIHHPRVPERERPIPCDLLTLLLHLSFCFGSFDLKRAISTQLVLRVKGRHLALNSFPGFPWAPTPKHFFFFWSVDYSPVGLGASGGGLGVCGARKCESPQTPAAVRGSLGDSVSEGASIRKENSMQWRNFYLGHLSVAPSSPRRVTLRAGSLSGLGGGWWLNCEELAV